MPWPDAYAKHELLRLKVYRLLQATIFTRFILRLPYHLLFPKV